MSLSVRGLALLALSCFTWRSLLAQSESPAQPTQNAPAQTKTEASDLLTFRTTVRRVVVDVVVRDSNNRPVHGLKASDFLVAEDGHPQNILSFDVFDLDKPSIALPPNTPHMPANHFVNIPATPEHGPLYVILYDMVNIEIDDQLDARRQIMKFIKNLPDGARFAIFVRSDNLYLVQGFTDDKALLFSVLDPANPKPHVPKVFMMGKNLGYGDPASMINVLTQVNEFLEGVPGHKNLIWLAGTFPLALVPRKEDPREYEDQIIDEINVLTRAQVAVYPINVGGVPVNPPGQLTGGRIHGGAANQNVTGGGQITGAPSGPGASGGGINSLTPGIGQSLDTTGLLASMAAQGSGDSVLTDYDVQRALAEATGGRAFYSTNDVTAALDEATDVGGNYYSLSYSPTNQKDDGGRRGIAVRVVQPGYKLSYRRFYFTTALRPQTQPAAQLANASAVPPAPAEYDALQPNMKHGAPMVHDLLFSAHIHADGGSTKASPEQMAKLSDQPAYSSMRHKDKDKPLAPLDLQKYVIDYRVTDLALKSQAGQNGKTPSFEFAAAAFDADSHMLNSIVNGATGDASTNAETSKSGVFRVRQQLDVPTNATWIRIGVRDRLTNRMGTLEVQLPLAPETPSPSVTSAR